jgi:hypothetical protein
MAWCAWGRGRPLPSGLSHSAVRNSPVHLPAHVPCPPPTNHPIQVILAVYLFYLNVVKGLLAQHMCWRLQGRRLQIEKRKKSA